jgi:hypothetical protein
MKSQTREAALAEYEMRLSKNARVGFLSELVGRLINTLEDSVYQLWRSQVVINL